MDGQKENVVGQEIKAGDLYDGAVITRLDEVVTGKEREFNRGELEREINLADNLEETEKLELIEVTLDSKSKPTKMVWKLSSAGDDMEELLQSDNSVTYSYFLEGVHSDSESTDRSVIIKELKNINGDIESSTLAEYFVEDKGWEVPIGSMVGKEDESRINILELFGVENDPDCDLDVLVAYAVTTYLNEHDIYIEDSLGAVTLFSEEEVIGLDQIYDDDHLMVTSDGEEGEIFYCVWVKM